MQEINHKYYETQIYKLSSEKSSLQSQNLELKVHHE